MIHMAKWWDFTHEAGDIPLHLSAPGFSIWWTRLYTFVEFAKLAHTTPITFGFMVDISRYDHSSYGLQTKKQDMSYGGFLTWEYPPNHQFDGIFPWFILGIPHLWKFPYSSHFHPRLSPFLEPSHQVVPPGGVP